MRNEIPETSTVSGNPLRFILETTQKLEHRVIGYSNAGFSKISGLVERAYNLINLIQRRIKDETNPTPLEIDPTYEEKARAQSDQETRQTMRREVRLGKYVRLARQDKQVIGVTILDASTRLSLS